MADTIKSTDVPGVHGLVALNPDGTAIGTPVGGATSDNQTNGTQKTQIVDAGGEAVTVTGGKLDVNATASLSGEAIPISGASTAVGVAIVDGSGNQITSFGGGTQYTEDAASATDPVGNALIMVRKDTLGAITSDDGDNIAARGTDKGELYIKHVDEITVNGAVTANAGTNLDTSALALESGGNLAAIKAKTDNIPALGQALAAESVPVVLTAAQISTLTPLSTVAVTQSGTWDEVGINDSGNSITVDATDLDIRDLSSASDSVTVAQATASSLNATVVQGTATNLKVQAESYQGGSAVAAGNPLQVSLANTAANATAVKVNVASGGIASGAIASGAIASGAIAAGAIAAGNTSIATTEDTARAAGEHLVKIGLSRLDTPVANANVGADNEYTNFTADNFGKLWVAGSVIEDAAETAGMSLMAAGTVRRDTAASSAGTTGDNATLNTDANGKLWVNAEVTAALPAGTNNIGDVDVASIANGSLNGPGSPTIDSYTKAAIAAVTGSNQQLIAAPGANKQIWVYGIGFTCTVAGTVAIQDEDDTAITGVMNYAQYSGPLNPPSGNFAMPLWKVATNKALEADVTTATINGWITYAIVSV